MFWGQILGSTAIRDDPSYGFSYSIYLLIYLLFCFFRAASTAYGGSQARSPIGATAASPHHSLHNIRSKPHLWLHHSPRQHQILNPLSKARDRTPIFTDPNQVPYYWAMTETPQAMLNRYAIYVHKNKRKCNCSCLWVLELPNMHVTFILVRKIFSKLSTVNMN